MILIKSCLRSAFTLVFVGFLAISGGVTTGMAQTAAPVLQIQADHVTAQMPPTFYGFMTEEINYSYEGGLYGELIRNRSFKANPTTAIFWTNVGSARMMIDTNTPLNSALNVSLKVELHGASKKFPAGVANGGYWGIAVRPHTTYHASFFAKAEHFTGPLTVSLVHVISTNPITTETVAQADVPRISNEWQKYEVTLTAGDVTPSRENQLRITATKSGSFFDHHGALWLQQVSLFPPTYKDRPNGDRIDLSQLLADARPKFLRFPGGNYVEGDNFKQRFAWKQTIGPLEERPGHRSPWGYWSTDGFGLPEFLGWCEDLDMEPVLAVFAGYTLNHDHVSAGPDLEPYVQEALEEIEYVTGGADTKWGAQRVKDGYPNPLPLHYVEIGNEDEFDRSGSYQGRFAQFYDAIKAKYPQLQVIATAPVTNRTPDLLDEHYYRSEEEMESQSFMYDERSRANKTKVFVGEWATRVGSPTPDMAGALGDAAWMCCLERNADIVMMHCYAPLLVNVSDLGRGRSMQWRSDLIGYDALNCYGSPSYYAQKIFSLHHGDQVLATSAQDLPTYDWHIPARRRNGIDLPPTTRAVKSLFYSATRDSQSGTIFVKVVNRADTPQDLKIEISGANSISGDGSAIALKADSRDATNSIDDPQKVVPVTEAVNGLGTNFTRTFPPCSITVLEIQAR